MSRIACLLVLLASVIVSAFSQVLLKKSSQEEHASWFREYLNAKVIAAYVLFFCAIFLDVLALNGLEVSFIPVAESAGVVFAIAFGAIFFRERISFAKIVGMLFIAMGIALYSF